jgi:HEAT repeat protein
VKRFKKKPPGDSIMPVLSAQEALDLIRNAKGPDAMGVWPAGLLGSIGSIDAPDVYRALAMLLRKEPATVRARAARLLGDSENPEALEALGPLLMDTDASVRFWAVWAVEQFGAVDDIVEPLAYLIAGDPNPQTRLLAIRALFFVRSNPEARAALELAGGDADPAVRAQAQRILSQT